MTVCLSIVLNCDLFLITLNANTTLMCCLRGVNPLVCIVRLCKKHMGGGGGGVLEILTYMLMVAAVFQQFHVNI